MKNFQDIRLFMRQLMAAMIRFLMMNELLLLSGNESPFVEGSITIHVPTIGEIAYIGEEAFFSGC